METLKNDFLLYILEDALCDDTQISIINEYLDNHGESRIYQNDSDGLEDMLECTDKSEIVRAISFGQYSWNDSYVKFNDYGNIESFNALWGSDSVWLEDMIAWLTEGDNSPRLDLVYTILDADEVADIQLHFVEELMEILDNEDESNINKWIEEKSIGSELICRENWNDLIANYKEWKKVDDWLKENGDE